MVSCILDSNLWYNKGEEFMRYVAAYDVASRMDLLRQDLLSAVKATVFERLPPESGGLIAVDRDGHLAMEFNSTGMYRGTVDAAGNAAIGIWQDLELFSVIS